MSRFGNLEFNDLPHEQDQQQGAHPAALKDETHYLNEAQAAFERGDFEKGLRSFAKVLEHNPRNISAWAGQVRMLIELTEYREAKMWADKALESFPREPELLAAKGVALARLGDLKGALAYSDASIEERGDTPYVWLARGDIFLARSEKRAAFCFEKALEKARHHWFVCWLASRIHSFYQQCALGLKYAQEALEQDPTRPVVWLQLARCQLALGLAGPARNSLDHARELAPHLPQAEALMRELSETTFLARVWARFSSLFRR